MANGVTIKDCLSTHCRRPLAAKAFPFGEGGSPSGETDEGMPQYEFAKVPGSFWAVPPLISQKSKIFASFPKGEAFCTPYRTEQYPMA